MQGNHDDRFTATFITISTFRCMMQVNIKMKKARKHLFLWTLFNLYQEGQCWSCNWECLYCDLSRDIWWNIAWALGKSLGFQPRNFPRAQAIFPCISLLSLQYKFNCEKKIFWFYWIKPVNKNAQPVVAVTEQLSSCPACCSCYQTAVQLFFNPFIQFVSQFKLYSQLQLSLRSDPMTIGVYYST